MGEDSGITGPQSLICSPGSSFSYRNSKFGSIKQETQHAYFLSSSAPPESVLSSAFQQQSTLIGLNEERKTYSGGWSSRSNSYHSAISSHFETNKQASCFNPDHVPQYQSPVEINAKRQPLADLHPQLEELLLCDRFLTSVSLGGNAVTGFGASSASQARGIIGLKNLGNTCFMNSVLQSLFAIEPLMTYFSNGRHKGVLNGSSLLKGQLVKAFSDLVVDVMQCVGEKGKVVSPTTLKRQIERRAPQFAGYEQHDAQELLKFLLDGLHEELNQPTKCKFTYKDDQVDVLPNNQKAIISWNRYQYCNNSFIVELFCGQFESTVTCLGCHGKSTTYDCFWDLSVPATGDTLEKCLDANFEQETLDEPYMCSHCKTQQKAKKGLLLNKLPPILVIHFKRFRVSRFSGRVEGKIESAISFPTRSLDVSRYLTLSSSQIHPQENKTQYDLIAISNHMGSLSVGHYTAITRNFDSGEWFNKNDSVSSPMNVSGSSMTSTSAYILVYQKSK